MDFQICQNTQSPEKFLCLNEECYSAEKKHIQCYQCLTKQHLSKNKVVRHVDDFIELEQFINEIKKKQTRRQTYIQMIFQQAIDFQKSKIQEVQLSRNPDLIKNATEKIEGDTTKFLRSLSTLYLDQKFTFPYQNSFHVQYVKFYFENENKYQEDSKSKLSILFSQTEKYMQTLDLDIRTTMKRSYQKLELLEKQVTQFSKSSFYNKLQLLILLLILPYLVYLQINQLEIIKYQRQYEQTSQIQEYLIQELVSIKDKYNMLDKKMEYLMMNETEDVLALNKTITEAVDGVQKLKLRFDAFKQSSTSNLEKFRINIQNSIETLQNNITYLQTQENNFGNQISQISSKINVLFLKKDDMKQLLELQKKEKSRRLKEIINQLEEKQVMRRIIQLKNYLYSLLHYRHLIKIHLNLSKSELKDFQLIYEELFDKPVLVYTMISIQQKVFKNEGDNPLVCLGGLSINSLDSIDLIACDFANDIFNPTFESDKAVKSSHGDIYWYQVQESSFGFAPNENIKLLYCDDYDEENEYRLSYWYNLRSSSGGRRLGKFTLLENSQEHMLQIYLLKAPFQ
ncbi:unnamed protein product (macronuclear) [Paramecium tetraurelia]|uniref:SUN domain-containing protein n=1 Tax=Paramecium tetraurelia TaxID=5888 RepID=A0CJM3_PARTE|nr:uncharacterized protein GSPATT00000702001 [Paramecium tetraurelia]CAK70990.1 unnamed protein product [Paramecium tetraurelia]|eukprot:XP_001438387.1 hypothetical protein (macronuclear) [Paramecium tetraurelia strain d4-2]